MAKKKKVEWIDSSETELKTNVEAWAKSTDLSNAVLFLEGEMGAGKSTFARALIQYLAPNTKSAGSPTFPLVQEYRAKDGFLIHHIDLYRIKSERELADSGIEEQIDGPGLKLVEWGSLFESHFSYLFTSKNQRKVLRILIQPGKKPETRSYFFTSF